MTEAFFENEVVHDGRDGPDPARARSSSAEEIAGAIVFLASPLARADHRRDACPSIGGWTAGEPALPW